MKSLVAAISCVVVVAATASYAAPTPKPKERRAKKASPAQRATTPAGVTGCFVLQLKPDGTVAKVLIVRSTGNKNIDAWTAKGLSFMRFPPETLTKEERAKGQKILPVTISEEQLKNARYLPTPQW